MSNELIGLSVSLQADKAIESVGSIKKAMREAQKEVQVLSDKFGATSKEAINAAKVAGELKDRIGDAKSLVDAFNPDAKFKAFSSSIAGVASGFAALQGAMGLFGAESEDVQKTLLKVQSAMAISQGLQSVGESIDSFKQLGAVIKSQVVGAFSTLKGAIAATGIGLLVVSLGLLVANFDAIKEAVLKAIPGLETFGKWMGKLVNSVTDFVGVTSEASRALDDLKNSTNAINKSLDSTIKILEAQGGRESEVYALKVQRIQNERKLLLDQQQLKGDLNDKEIEQLLNLNTELAVLEATEKNRKQKQSEEDAKLAVEKQLEREAAQKAALDKEYQAELDTYNKRKKLRGKEEQETVDSYLSLSEKSVADKAAKAEQERLANEALETMRNSALGIRIEKDAAAGAEIVEQNKATAIANIALAKAEEDAKIKSFEAVSSAITNLAMIAGKETVAGKALAIAASLINTYKGITAALGSAPPPFNFISAAAVGAAGFAAVKNIVSVQVPGGGGGGSAVPSAPSLSAGSPLAAPVASQQTSLDQRSINAMGNRAIKAYVVETEISSAQQKIRKIEQQTSF